MGFLYNLIQQKEEQWGPFLVGKIHKHERTNLIEDGSAIEEDSDGQAHIGRVGHPL